MGKISKILFIFFMVVVQVPVACAHTPLKPEGENNSLESALSIPDPIKSWTLYRELHEVGEAEYFQLHLHEGDMFVVSVYTPRNIESQFVPNLVVMGPEIEGSSSIPAFIEVPLDVDTRLIEGFQPDAPDYEPFTPASYFFTAAYRADVRIEGDYYFVVYSDDGEGRYGVAVGYVETFTILEWVMIPLDVIGIHQWEGQSLVLILAPMVVTGVLGLFVLFWKVKPQRSLLVWMGVVAGLLYIGSSFILFTQMFIAIVGATSTSSAGLTVVFAVLPLILGVLLIRKMIGIRASFNTRDRVIMLIYSILGFVVWSGLLIGPVLSIIASIIPVKIEC